VIERCFVEVRRTRPMLCFVDVEIVDRIIYSIFQRFNMEWKTRALNLFTLFTFTQAARLHPSPILSLRRLFLARELLPVTK